MPTCAQCGAQLPREPFAGRGGERYCSPGCLDLGERACGTSCALPGTFSGTAIRLGIGVLVVGQSMIFGLALNLHDDVPRFARAVTQWLIFGGTVLVAALLGGPLARAAWTEARRGRVTIEALFVLTGAGALAASLQAHLTGRGHIYYEVVSVLLVVYTLGKLIGARAAEHARAQARAWGDSLAVARVVCATGTRTAPVFEVCIDDVVEVRPGEAVCVDGVVAEGTGFVSETAVSGEPFAAVRRPGDRVLAGAVSADATFRVRATAPGTARQVDKLLAAVDAARDKPLSLQSRADALGRWFFPFVACTALGTFAYWSAVTGWETGLFNAMSVLLVACPCVIGLATPLIVWTALNRLAERGIVVRGGDTVERLAEVDRVLFDKTGTLTDDRFALVDIETPTAGEERARVLGWLALVQAHSAHPVAKPFAELPKPFAPGTEPRVTNFALVPGCGVRADLTEADGTRHAVRVGTSSWIRGEVDPRIVAEIDGAVAAVATVAERVRDSARETLAHFARLGLPVEVLTGDAPGRAEALGLPAARAGLLPDDKRATVEALVSNGAKPLFVGDGINDASALAAAHCGVALASGTDLAVSAADATLYGGDLRALPRAIEECRAAVRAARANLRRAVAYNLIGMALAACGALHPVFAAVLMFVSSVSLLFSSARCHGGAGVGVEASVVRPTPLAPLPEGSGEQEPSELDSVDGARGPFSPLPSGRGAGGGEATPEASPKTALAHFLAFAAQGFVLLALTGSANPFVPVAFALVGGWLAVEWARRPRVPHELDMCFGMLTLGNLGMLLGWWADAGFAPLPCAKCACASLQTPWMWVGMLALSNVAMKWWAREPAPDRAHEVAMYTGGNAGMVAGMIAGGQLAAHFSDSIALAFALMTAGMLAGMIAGTRFASRLRALA
jgi:heavy metal translocating P-type ATPase